MNLRKIVSIAASAAMLMSSAALAENISFDGSVVASSSVQVYTTLGGTVDSVPVKAGDVVTADTALATLRTTKVYAQEDGVISSVFGQNGDDATTVSDRYGAVLYLEGNVKYTISATTNAAYSSIASTYITSGETVYLRAKATNLREGVGLVTNVSGTSYTVEVISGSFIVGESVNIYRSSAFKDSTMLGRGNASRAESTAVTAEGTIVNIPVTAGQSVKRGDLLLETLTGSADALAPTGSSITAGVNGVVASVSISEGDTVEANTLTAVIYPEGSMVVEGSIYESDLGSVHVGDAATVTLTWNEDNGITYPATITAISSVGTESTSEDTTESSYTVTVAFTPDNDTRYGMTATVHVGTDEADEEDEETAEVTESAESAESAEDAASSATQSGEMPSFNGELPEGMTPPEGMTLPEGATPPSAQ